MTIVWLCTGGTRYRTRCSDYVLVGRCWTLCFLFSRQNLTASRHFSWILYFLIFFRCNFAHSVFFYHLLLGPGTGRFVRNSRPVFQQSNVAILYLLVSCAYFACRLKCKRRLQSLSQFLAGAVAYCGFRYSLTCFCIRFSPQFVIDFHLCWSFITFRPSYV